MKRCLKVTVDGKAYDVVVEDVKEGEASKNVTEETIPVVEPVKSEIKEDIEVSNKAGNIKVLAPMPGSIWKIKTSVGKKVEKHEVLLILEAMKMENEIVAPEAGIVTAILVNEGDSVEPGKIMVELA